MLPFPVLVSPSLHHRFLLLINNLRNDIISYQLHVLNLQKKSKKKLLKKLSSEKNNRPQNLALISELEGKLLIIEEN